MMRTHLPADSLSQATSRLGRALVQLNAALERIEEREARIEGLLSAWDRSWENRRSEILQWLSAVDAAADRPHREAPPPLALVRIPIDADEMLPMLEP